MYAVCEFLTDLSANTNAYVTEAFATPQSEYLPDIEDNLPYIEDDLPSTKHTLRGEARSLQLPDPAMVCGVNRVWICRGMFSDQCVINTSRLPNLLARTHSVLGKCACNLNRADIDCCQDFDCGDIAFRKCNMDSNQCFDLPCDAATQNGVGCCQDSECGNDAAFRICNMVSKQCENLPCNVTTQNNVDCCQDSDCGNLAFLECNLNSKKCVDLPCNATTQDGIDCCEDEDCISPGTCFDNTCVDEPRFCVPGVAGAECCEDTDCPGNFDCSSSNRCVQRNCNTGQQDIDCCSDSDCDTSAGAGESCSSNVCIVEGNPRATLIWNGDGKYSTWLRSVGHKFNCLFLTLAFAFGKQMNSTYISSRRAASISIMDTRSVRVEENSIRMLGAELEPRNSRTKTFTSPLQLWENLRCTCTTMTNLVLPILTLGL
jgi:hypothetical protein